MGDRHLKFHELRDNLRAPLVHTYCPLSEVKVQVAASRIREDQPVSQVRYRATPAPAKPTVAELMTDSRATTFTGGVFPTWLKLVHSAEMVISV